MNTSDEPYDAASTVSAPPSRERKRRFLRCVLVEDQDMFLELLRGMLVMQRGLRVVGQARTVAEGISVCDKHSPDLLLLDLTLPDGDGTDVARQFVKRNPAGKVVIITGQKSSFVCPSWLDSNLHALVSKNDTFQTLRTEIEDLIGDARPALPTPATPARPGPGVPLTDREAEVFALIGAGLSSREIAEQLHIAVYTVLTHRKRIAKKLGTRGIGLVTRAVAQRTTFLGSNSR